MSGGVGESMLIGAAIGAGASALQGGNPLLGAGLGALGGGATSGFFGGATSTAAGVPGAAGSSAAGSSAAGSSAAGMAPDAIGTLTQGLEAGMPIPAAEAAANAVGEQGANNGIMSFFSDKANRPMLMGALQFAPLLARLGESSDMPDGKYRGPLSRFSYSPDKYKPLDIKSPTPVKRKLAAGGITALPGAEQMAAGKLIKGPGDGMSDSVPATIDGSRPARLGTGEFVVPADVVSHLGNGATESGAKQLYAMMERVRKARTGNAEQGRKINPRKMLPA